MRRVLKTFLMLLLCALLFGLLSYLLLDYREQGIKEKERLEKLVSEGKEEKSENSSSKEEPSKEETSQEDSEEEEEPEAVEETKKEAEGVACWGDELLSTQAAATNSYTVVLQKLLTDQGYNLTVANKTLTETCSLTTMKMAGVPMTDIDAYIAKHQAAANGAQLPITEGATRNLTAEQMTRTDQNYIPVLFMGYYGGWNYDTKELIEQQQKILDTFGDYKDSYIIVGLAPASGRVTAEQYNADMRAAWGEHYIACSDVCAQGALSYEGQQEIAQAVFNKMVELQYIQKKADA
ncbi:MAG: hypothetical protein Q4F24_05325 [Eubacteriales bacterium]|nr:hypothetical protein [Eubacteriales bacterium]